MHLFLFQKPKIKNDTELNLFESINSSISATAAAGGGKGMSVAALVCGIVGLFFGGIILGPLAIIFGVIGMKERWQGNGYGTCMWYSRDIIFFVNSCCFVAI